MDDTEPRTGDGSDDRVGLRLQHERERQELDLDEVAVRTRVPKRHLVAIEGGDHDVLPAPTYSAGFVKIYASVLGLDGVAYAREFRREIEGIPRERYVPQPFEPADPARVPSRALALVALAIALLLAAGYAVWRGGYIDGDTAEERARLAAGTSGEPVATVAAPGGGSPAPGPAPAGGPVVLTAIEPVWLRVYDGDGGPRLLEKVMAAGERYEVPTTARDPQILTGRPQVVRITVGNAEIPPLGTGERSISDVSLLPAALLARLTPATPPATAPVATP